MYRTLARLLSAFLLSLAVIAGAPAVAGAQSWFPSNWAVTHPPVLGMQAHPFEFDGDWADGAPLTTDVIDYVAWYATEDDFKTRALYEGYTENDYYGTTALTGTTYTAPNATGGWNARIVRWLPSTATSDGFYCVYTGVVPQSVVGSNTFTQTGVNCQLYDFPGTGQPWDRPTPTRIPPDAEAHPQDVCAGIGSICATIPIGWSSQEGGADKAVLDQLAIPSWNANHTQPYNGQVGHIDTHGYPGNWNVTVMLYATDFGGLHQPYRCRYFAKVTGSESAPVVTPTAAPSCGYYGKVRPD